MPTAALVADWKNPISDDAARALLGNGVRPPAIA